MRRIAFCLLCAILWEPHISPAARAQSRTSQQFWPALNVHKSISTFSRFSLEAQQTRENQTGEDAQIGAFLDLYVKPLIKLQSAALRSSAMSKPRLLQWRAGYQYLRSTDNPPENRIVLATTPRLPLVFGIVANNRNRVDFRFISGQSSWRYRNRFMVERSFSIGAHDFTPYAHAEAFYDSRYEKWSRITGTAGVTFAVQKHVEMEAYFQHQKDSSSLETFDDRPSEKAFLGKYSTDDDLNKSRLGPPVTEHFRAGYSLISLDPRSSQDCSTKSSIFWGDFCRCWQDLALSAGADALIERLGVFPHRSATSQWLREKFCNRISKWSNAHLPTRS